MGDTGTASDKGGLSIDVTDVQKPVPGLFVHKGKVVSGEIRRGQVISLAVDQERRARIAANHTATHLLQLSLRTILGSHVKQAGSKVGPDEFRFDYTHFSALTSEEIQKVETMVNALICKNDGRIFKELSLAEARAEGLLRLSMRGRLRRRETSPSQPRPGTTATMTSCFTWWTASPAARPSNWPTAA